MSKIIVLMGAPGAGKGTQARLLQERMALPQISTGDIFRALAQSDTPLAQEVRVIQQSGRLIPDEVVMRVVEARTEAPDCRAGYVLDGYPRTTVQAEMLESLAARQGHELMAVFVDVPSALLTKRLTGRRNCPVCGEIYNVYFKPPRIPDRCDEHTDAVLIHRADDALEKISVRLETYEKETAPLLSYYEQTSRLHRVDGTRETEEIYAEIERIVTSG